MIEEEIKILLIEDNPTDVLLIKRQLKKLVKQPIVEVETTIPKIKLKIATFKPDIVLCDYNLPTCNGMEVLDAVRSLRPDIMFIFVTGTIKNEELAANTILNGASGYILKKNINELDKKLKPYFMAFVNNKVALTPVRQQIDQSKKLVKDIEQFLKNFSEENLANKESMKRIQDELSRLRKDNGFIKKTEDGDQEKA